MRITLVVLFLLCGVGVFAGSPQTSPANHKITKSNGTAHSNQPSNEGTEQHPFFVKIIPSPKNYIDTNNDQDERNRKTIIEIVTILIGIATAVILFYQLKVFGRQAERLKETIEEMKVATKATEKTADAANKSAIASEVATESFIKAERPYVFVTVTYGINSTPSSDNVEWICHYKATNHGKTPAILTFIIGHIFIGENEPPNIAETMNDLIAPGCVVIGAGESDIFNAREQIDGAHATSIENGKSATKLYCHGIIKYTDIFGDNPHFTKFCRVFDNRGYEKGFYVTCNKKLNECT